MSAREAMQMALDALERVALHLMRPQELEVMQALRAQLEQQAEPVALIRDGVLRWHIPHEHYARPAWTAHGTHMLYTAQAQQQAEPVTCAWSFEDDDTGTYSSACGELWSFIDGGWKDNRVRFCHGCGGKVVEAKLKETR